jgi:hypothetical protein
MGAVLLLLVLSACLGFAVGTAFAWFAILVSGAMLAMLSAIFLKIAGFGPVAGIGIITACLVVNQAAYLLGLMRRGSLDHEQADQKPREDRDD